MSSSSTLSPSVVPVKRVRSPNVPIAGAWSRVFEDQRCVACPTRLAAVLTLGVSADVRETHKVVIKHIQSARNVPGLHDATVVLVLESNLA